MEKLERWEREQYEKMMKELNGIELTDKEKKTIKWLAGWESETVENMLAIFRKLKMS